MIATEDVERLGIKSSYRAAFIAIPPDSQPLPWECEKSTLCLRRSLLFVVSVIEIAFREEEKNSPFVTAQPCKIVNTRPDMPFSGWLQIFLAKQSHRGG